MRARNPTLTSRNRSQGSPSPAPSHPHLVVVNAVRHLCPLQHNSRLLPLSSFATSSHLLVHARDPARGDAQKRQAKSHGNTDPNNQQDCHKSFNLLSMTLVSSPISTIGAGQDCSAGRSPEYDPGDFPRTRVGPCAESRLGWRSILCGVAPPRGYPRAADPACPPVTQATANGLVKPPPHAYKTSGHSEAHREYPPFCG